MERATWHRQQEPFSGLKTPLLYRRTRRTRSQEVALGWPQPEYRENPAAFQPGRVAFCTVSMEKMPVPAILQPI